MSKAKSPKSSTKPKTKTPQQMLCKEIADVCKLLDEEGLVFLKRQADVLLHNSRVEKIRKETPVSQPLQAARNPVQQPAHTQAAEPKSDAVRVEQTTNTTFNIWVGKTRVFFNRDEMRAIARICHAAGNPVEGGKRLFAWFRRERTDFIIDTDIGGSTSPLLAQLCSIITKTYAVRD